jgi:mycothiol synthase
MPPSVELAAELDDELVAHARAVLEQALPPDLVDDRFADSWVDAVRTGSAPFLAARCRGGGAPIGWLGGTVEAGHLALDALVAPAGDEGDEAEVLDALLRAVLPRAAHADVEILELWARPVRPFHEAVALAHGMTPARALHQLRCRLPVVAEPVPTRGFVPGRDDDALLAVNNRAFASHPDQGRWTLDDLHQRFTEPWFEADGLRIHEREGRIAAFCWTKIHQQPPLGEIYVIGVDPDFHGQGLGVPVTAAGLHWLADRGLDTGMLYVEADNEPALRTYDRLGFAPVRTDRSWRMALG